MKYPALIIAGTLLSLAECDHACAQPFPAKPVRFVVPFAPGGGTDFLTRLISQRLAASLAQPVVVDNRPGAGGVIGADLVAKAPADGHTILLGSPGSLSISPNLLPNAPYDPLRDFAPLTLATVSPFALTANPAVPAASVKELIALAKARPGQLNFGTAGTGATGHIAGEQFKLLAGVNIVHVPFKGSAFATTAVIAGEIQLTFENLPVALPHARSGRLKILGVGSAERSPLAPEFPTIREGGVTGYEAVTAFGVLAPAKTPHRVIEKLNQEIVKILHDPEVRDMLALRGMQSVGNTTAEYALYMRREFTRYGEIIRKAGIKIE